MTNSAHASTPLDLLKTCAELKALMERVKQDPTRSVDAAVAEIKLRRIMKNAASAILIAAEQNVRRRELLMRAAKLILGDASYQERKRLREDIVKEIGHD